MISKSKLASEIEVIAKMAKTISSKDSHYNSVRRGKHKIFIGMAPGVGKTVRMLEEGHARKREGIDVAIGLLETHGRIETVHKAAGLEIVPYQRLTQNGSILTEMDSEAILARSPQLVLVDELAHTNAPGSLREKRYQDVETFLDAGINVYSTVNIQHLESLSELVAQMTGVVVRDRIPHRLLEEAHEVVVVDVTLETLEERLLEGKIYAPEKIQQVRQNLFQRRNLTLLRELALREVADNCEENALASIPSRQSCYIHERVLVCVSTYHKSLQLLRRGAQMADCMNASLYVVFVNSLDRDLNREERLHVETCKHLCKEFGGTFICVNNSDVVKAIAEVAQQHRITQIIIGESQRSLWQLLLRGSLTQKLVRLLKHIDIHIMKSS